MSNKTKNILAKNQTFETNSEYLKEDGIAESIEKIKQKKNDLFLLTNVNACLFLLTKEYLKSDNDFQLFIDNKEVISIDLSKESQQTGLFNINQLWDSQFENDTSCWKSTRKNTDFTFGIDVSADWTLKHSHTAYLYQESAHTSEKITLIYHDPVIGDLLPVQAGENYAIGGCFACHRCDAAFVIEFYNSNNEKVLEKDFSISSEKLKGGRHLDDYLHIAESISIPDGIDFIRVLLIKLPTKTDSTPDNSFFFFTHLFFTLTGNNCKSEWSNNPFSYEDWLQLRNIKSDDVIQSPLSLPNKVFDNKAHKLELRSSSIETPKLSLVFCTQHSDYHWERFQLSLNECLAGKNWKKAANILADWFNQNPQDMLSSGIQMFNHDISDKQSIFETATIEALQVIRCLTELTPENAYAWQCLAEVNYQLKRWQECLNAYEAFSKLSELDKNNTEQFIVVLKKLYRYEDVCRVYLRSWAVDDEKEHLTSLLEVLRNCDGLQLSAEEIKWLCVANRKHAKTDVQKLMMEIIPRLSTQTLNELFMKLDNGYDLIIQSLTFNLEYAETKHNWAVALKILKVLDVANMINPLPDWLAIEMLWMAVQLEHLILVSDSALGMLYKENLAELKCLQPWQQAELFDQNFLLLDQNYLRYGQSWKQPPKTAITRLSQFLAQPESKYLSPHPLFDASWHNTNKNIRHSLVEFFRRSSSTQEKLPKPNPYFDSDWYKEHYLENNRCQHPLLHYLAHFKEKDIQPNYYVNSDYVRETQCLLEDEEVLSYYLGHLKSGGSDFCLNGFSPTPFFNRQFYLGHNKDVLPAVKNGLDPFLHFIQNGIREGRQAYAWQRYNEFVRHHRFYLEPYNWHCHFGLENSLRYIKGEKAEITYFAGQHELVKSLSYQPLISILVPVYQVKPRFFEEMLQSVLAQTYPHWQLCLVDDGSKRYHNEITALFEKYSAKDSRIVCAVREENGHICHTSNDCLTLAQGEYVALLDHDDLLTADALYEIASALNENPKLDIIYSDEDKVDEWGMFYEPYYKPDWSPHSLWARMYVCHLTVYRKSLVDSVNGFRVGFEGSQDYDLILRCSEKTKQIHHIQRVLYHWRSHSESTAAAGSEAKDYCADAGYRAVTESFLRRGLEVETGLIDESRTAVWVKPKVIGMPLIDIIIPCRNGADILKTCLESIFEKTTYQNFKVTVIDNASDEEEFFELIDYWKEKESSRFQVIRDESPFNFSAINNSAVHKTTGAYLLFLNNDTEVITEDWIEGMLGYAQLEEVGAVGCKLYYYDDTVQHAGVVTGLGGIAGHVMKHSDRNSPGYFWNLKMSTNYSVVTAACLMISREKFNAVNGFTEYLQVAFNDVDFCLKVREQSLYNVYLPFVELYHYESKSRGYEDTPKKQERFEKEIVFMRQRWGKVLDNDPFYSPWLKLDREDMSYRFH